MEDRRELHRWPGTSKFPTRRIHSDRHRCPGWLFRAGIKLESDKAIAGGVAGAKNVAVGKSLVASCGKRNWKKNPPGLRGVDGKSDWGCSQHDGWVQGKHL